MKLVFVIFISVVLAMVYGVIYGISGFILNTIFFSIILYIINKYYGYSKGDYPDRDKGNSGIVICLLLILLMFIHPAFFILSPVLAGISLFIFTPKEVLENEKQKRELAAKKEKEKQEQERIRIEQEKERNHYNDSYLDRYSDRGGDCGGDGF